MTYCRMGLFGREGVQCWERRREGWEAGKKIGSHGGKVWVRWAEREGWETAKRWAGSQGGLGCRDGGLGGWEGRLRGRG